MFGRFFTTEEHRVFNFLLPAKPAINSFSSSGNIINAEARRRREGITGFMETLRVPAPLR